MWRRPAAGPSFEPGFEPGFDPAVLGWHHQPERLTPVLHPLGRLGCFDRRPGQRSVSSRTSRPFSRVSRLVPVRRLANDPVGGFACHLLSWLWRRRSLLPYCLPYSAAPDRRWVDFYAGESQPERGLSASHSGRASGPLRGPAALLINPSDVPLSDQR